MLQIERNGRRADVVNGRGRSSRKVAGKEGQRLVFQEETPGTASMLMFFDSPESAEEMESDHEIEIPPLDRHRSSLWRVLSCCLVIHGKIIIQFVVVG